MKKFNKKGVGAMKGLLGLGIGLGVLGIALAFTARVTNTVSTGQTGVALAAANNGTLAISEMAGWLPTIAIVGVAAFLIGFLLVAFRS